MSHRMRKRRRHRYSKRRIVFGFKVFFGWLATVVLFAALISFILVPASVRIGNSLNAFVDYIDLSQKIGGVRELIIKKRDRIGRMVIYKGDILRGTGRSSDGQSFDLKYFEKSGGKLKIEIENK